MLYVWQENSVKIKIKVLNMHKVRHCIISVQPYCVQMPEAIHCRNSSFWNRLTSVHKCIYVSVEMDHLWWDENVFKTLTLPWWDFVFYTLSSGHRRLRQSSNCESLDKCSARRHQWPQPDNKNYLYKLMKYKQNSSN